MLKRLKMVEVMTPRPITVHPHDKIHHAAGLMSRHRVRFLPVTLGSELVGLLSERDLRLAAHYRYPSSLRVQDLMRERPYTLSPDCDVSKALRMMASFKFEAIPVITNRRTLNGIFTRHDAINLIHQAIRRPEAARLAA